jgi:hypothetical protein
VQKIGTYKGCEKPRNVKYWKDRQEVYIGHAGGRMFIYNSQKISEGPICNFLKKKGN